MERILVCPVCGKKFSTDKNAVKYCSPGCRRKANRAPALVGEREFVCAWCGGSFSAHRKRKYCSGECRLSANGRYAKREKSEKKSVLTLSQVAFLSREAGMSYGEYVCRYQIR